jgi:Methylamine utilisation protein MauE
MAELSLFLALVLMMAAAHKVMERGRMAASAAALTGASAALGSVLSIGAAAYEAVVALALLFPTSRPSGALLAAGLWALYGVALARSLGSSLDCGCSFASREKSIDSFVLARAFCLAVLSIALFLVPAGSFTILTPFAALGFFALYLALGELTSITSFGRRDAA